MECWALFYVRALKSSNKFDSQQKIIDYIQNYYFHALNDMYN